VAISPPISAAPDRLPPQNTEAEVSVLGSVLITASALAAIQIDVRLRPEDFYLPKHQLVYRAMLRLDDLSQPVDALTVCADLDRNSELEEAGGTTYVHSLPSSVPSAAHARNYAQIVKEQAQLRRLLSALRDAQEKVFTYAGPPRELLDQTESAIYQVAHDETQSELMKLEDVLHAEIDKLEELSKHGVSLTGTPSGFRDLDEITGGFQGGNLIVLAGRPSMGKSAFALNMAENAALGTGMEGRGPVPVALFSLEMSQVEIAHRMLGSQAKISGDALRKGQVKSDWRRVLQASEKLSKAPLWIDDSSDLGIHELRAKVRRLKGRVPELGLVIVDYLQLMRADESIENRVLQIGHMSRGLKLLARELNIPVMALSQLSRKVEDRTDKRPMLSDLRESGAIEQDSDVVMFIYRDEVYNKDPEVDNEGDAEIIVGKHRNGPIGTVQLVWQAKWAKFMNKAHEYEVHPMPAQSEPAAGSPAPDPGPDPSAPPPDEDDYGDFSSNGHDQ
jgi:replicative DNA helicase